MSSKGLSNRIKLSSYVWYNPIFDSWVKNNTSQSQYLQGMRGIIVSF